MEISLAKLMQIIRRKIWWIALVAAACGVLAFSYTQMFVKPTYTSTVKMVVVKSEDRQSTVSDAAIAQRLVNSYVAVLDDLDFYDKVAAKANLEYTGKQLSGMFSFSVVGETEVFEIIVTANNPQDTKIIADAASDVALSNTQYKNALDLVTLKETSPAREGVKVGPSVMRNTLLGAILGAAVIVFIAFLQEVLDVRIKSEDDVLEHYDLPLLGTIPDFSPNTTKKNRRQ